MLARGTILVSTLAGGLTAAAAGAPSVLQDVTALDNGQLVLMSIAGFGSVAALSAGAVYRGLVAKIDTQGERHDARIAELRGELKELRTGQQEIRDTVHESRGEVRAARDFRSLIGELLKRTPGDPHGSES